MLHNSPPRAQVGENMENTERLNVATPWVARTRVVLCITGK